MPTRKVQNAIQTIIEGTPAVNNPPVLKHHRFHQTPCSFVYRTCLPENVYFRALSHPSAHPYGIEDGFTRRTRARVPKWFVFAFIVLALVTPAAAIDEPYALSSASTGQHLPSRLPVGFFDALLFLVGQYAVAFSGTLVGPLMGITSVLWLMMRNDAAIDPRASWM
jgi:hypothetical protein